MSKDGARTVKLVLKAIAALATALLSVFGGQALAATLL